MAAPKMFALRSGPGSKTRPRKGLPLAQTSAAMPRCGVHKDRRTCKGETSRAGPDAAHHNNRAICKSQSHASASAPGGAQQQCSAVATTHSGAEAAAELATQADLAPLPALALTPTALCANPAAAASAPFASAADLRAHRDGKKRRPCRQCSPPPSSTKRRMVCSYPSHAQQSLGLARPQRRPRRAAPYGPTANRATAPCNAASNSKKRRL